jgi:DNA-binding MarR family transcriptional regulator
VSKLDAARATFRRWQHLPDTGALDVILGTVAANRLPGDPVWTLLVGPPGGGKSEILNAVSQLEDAHPTATLTEASLLSGTAKKERAASAKGGLLHVIGAHGIIVCKDFGSVLSMNRDARSLVLAALREIFDGSWTRHVGTDGGKTLSWSGHVGLVGGCTPTIDRAHGVMGTMGERFCLYRLPKVDAKTQGRHALRHAGRETTMRAELAEACRSALGDTVAPRERTETESEQLIDLATFVVRARSAVERDGYSREIELVSEPEAPTRLVIVLARLLDGLDAIGCEREQAFATVVKTALDSIPALRLAVLRTLNQAGCIDTTEVADAVQHPPTTTRRTLEDLTAHGLVTRERQGDGKAHRWTLTPFAEEHLATFPETSEALEDLYLSRCAHSTTFRESTPAQLGLT